MPQGNFCGTFFLSEYGSVFLHVGAAEKQGPKKRKKLETDSYFLRLILWKRDAYSVKKRYAGMTPPVSRYTGV